MADYKFSDAKWGTPFFGSSGGTVTWSFALTTGQFFDFDARISDAVSQDTIRQAFQAWEDVADIDFVEISDSADSNIRLAWDAIDGAYNTVGEAYYNYYIDNYNRLISAEIRFDTAENWAPKSVNPGQTSLYSVALHEIGHAIGLDHNDRTDSVLYYQTSGLLDLSHFDVLSAQLLYGNAASNAITGSVGNDTLQGGGISESYHGLSGNDRIIGNGGDDRIDGGSGIDFSVYSGGRNDYVTNLNNDGTRTVTDIRGNSPDGSDVLIGVERLEFSDGTLAFDIAGGENSGSAYRLYEAAFDRVPDVEGLGYWIRELDQGKGDLAWVANNFIISVEFQNTYGTPHDVSNEAFLDLLYQNVLGRGPDEQGLEYWITELDNGFERARVLASFAVSEENHENVSSSVQDGIWYI